MEDDMGLVAPQPSVNTSSTLDGNVNPITSADITEASKDTFINRTAISPQTYPDIYGTLLSYVEGIPVPVEYFRKRVPYINNQAVDTSFSLERAAVHTSYDLVHNFEIVIQNQLTIEVDPETSETKVSGEAIIYPGFNPNPGDVFYFRLPDANIGVFVVDSAIPLSIAKGTHYQIAFHLTNYLNDQIDAKLRASVAEELYFDKQHYFSDEVCLLSTVSYNQLNTLLSSRKAIINRIITKFYNNSEHTIIRPDGIYDAFLVEFLMSKISISDNRRDICQISNTYIDAYDWSIWKAITDQDITQFRYSAYGLNYYTTYLWDTNISNVDNFRIVTLVDTEIGIDIGRTSPAVFEPTDIEPLIVSYHFSNRLYYSIIRSFEDASVITDIVPLLLDMSDDPRIFPNYRNEFFSINDLQYHPIEYFDVHSKTTGSNNDIHLPEIEFFIFDYLVNNNIDVTYLVDSVLSKFPFKGMKDIDQFYYLPLLLHLIDVSIPRIR
jgi:hypothetical protein